MKNQELQKLIENSISLSVELKQAWIEKIPEFTDNQKQQVAEALLAEQQAEAADTENYLQKVQQLNNQKNSVIQKLEKEFNRADLNAKDSAERKFSEQKAEDILHQLDEI